jgi:hypothetical protein
MDHPKPESSTASRPTLFTNFMAGVLIILVLWSPVVFLTIWNNHYDAMHERATQDVQDAAEMFDDSYRAEMALADSRTPAGMAAAAAAAVSPLFPSVEVDEITFTGDKVQFTGPARKRASFSGRFGFTTEGERPIYCLYLPTRLEVPTVMGPGPC